MFKIILCLCTFLISFNVALATEQWETLPPTPKPIAGETTGYAKVNSVKLYYATLGKGTPVVVLHGGFGNSDYMGNQARALATHHKVILVDSRGQGRSALNGQIISYDLMADDVVALLDTLKISRVDVVGWSDGGIIGIDMAMRYPDRVRKVFSFGANTLVSGTRDNYWKDPTVAEYVNRVGRDYAKLSPTPQEYKTLTEQMHRMGTSEPNWSDADLKTIRARVLIADGDHDEIVKREHTEYIAATVPNAGLLILPNSSHFALLQDPALFNAAMLHFIDDK
jgi:pimeloyl-ACP methyl ester carboxylesterase